MVYLLVLLSRVYGCIDHDKTKALVSGPVSNYCESTYLVRAIVVRRQIKHGLADVVVAPFWIYTSLMVARLLNGRLNSAFRRSAARQFHCFLIGYALRNHFLVWPGILCSREKIFAICILSM